MRKSIVVSGLIIALSGCDQNLSTTIYTRDIKDLLASRGEQTLPIDVEIEIWEMGIENQCSKPEGAKVIEAIGSVFEKATLVGCEKVSGSMKDKMVIKATTMVAAAQTKEVIPGPYLVHFDIHETDEVDKAFVVARFNKEQYVALQDELRRMNPMNGIKLDDVSVSISINNDEREPMTVYPFIGTFADGEPIDGNHEVALEPRQETRIKFGDVKTAYLARWGWTGVANVRMASPGQ